MSIFCVIDLMLYGIGGVFGSESGLGCSGY